MVAVENIISWSLLFQLLVIAAVFLVLVQIWVSDCLDRVRRHQTQRLLFRARRAAMFLLLLSLIGAVIYGRKNGWDPWPPVVIFMFLFNVYIITQILVMRDDLARFGRIAMLSGRPDRVRF
jgi:hypothetical protein